MMSNLWVDPPWFTLQDASVDELFKLLEEKTGVPPEEARLLHAGKELVQKQEKRISDYPSILHGSTLFMVMRLKGGEFTVCCVRM